MKTKILKLQTFSAILFFSFLASCQKETGENGCSINTSSVAGTYKLTAMVYKESPAAAEQDFLVLRDDCEQDDLMTFEANGVLQYKDLGLTCGPDASFTSAWSVNGNNIVVDGDAGIIQRFDCNELVIKGENVLTVGDAFFYTFKKQ